MKQVLTIAGSDSGGGAGIQADLKTFHANRTFGMSVITSVTAQNTQEVRRAFDLPLDVIDAQIDAVFDDFDVAAVKTGMLSCQEIVETVCQGLSRHRVPHLVVDPVMVSTGGFALLADDAVACMKGRLLPLAGVVTPNRYEAQLLANMTIDSVEDAKIAARKILDCGPRAVLIKGGHLDLADRSVDVLWDGERASVFEAERIDTPHTHGTGCTYSAAIAAQLARGCSLVEAVGKAKGYITEAIRHGLAIGHGHGPTHHFYFLSETSHKCGSR